MIRQESGPYLLQNYMENELSSSDNENHCSCDRSELALHTLQECAKIVTDLSSRPLSKEPYPTKAVGKSPSAVSVRDFYQHPPTTSMANSFSCCTVCRKPMEQELAHTQRQQPQYGSQTPPEDSFAFWRQQMFDWTCVVIDSYGIADRSEVIAVAFSVLDRYVAHELHQATVPITRDDFQLFGMTALYIAIKLLQGRNKLSIDALVLMSRGFYSHKDVVATENDMLKALQWRLHAPTPIAYCRLLCDMLQVSASSEDRLQRCCAYLTELAVSDASFVGCKASMVALAAIVLAARLDNTISDRQIHDFVASLQGLMIREDGHPVSDFQRVYRQLEVLYGD